MSSGNPSGLVPVIIIGVVLKTVGLDPVMYVATFAGLWVVIIVTERVVRRVRFRRQDSQPG